MIIAGLLTAIGIVGIPLLIWGIAADRKLKKHAALLAGTPSV